MMRRCGLICALSMILLCSANSHAAGRGPTLLVIPARYTVVQFSFDIARMRSVYLLSYRSEGDAINTFLWDKRADDWVAVDSTSGDSLFASPPARTIVVGRVDEGAIGLSNITGDAGVTSRIPSLDLKDVVNGLHAELKFRGTEWRWLASRYGFELKDRNAERRRWGRYGRPGKARMPTSERLKPAPVVPEHAYRVPVIKTPPPEPEVIKQPKRKTLVITLPKDFDEKGLSSEPESEAPPPVKGLVVDPPEPEPMPEPEPPAPEPEPDVEVEDAILDESAIEGDAAFDAPAMEGDLAPEDK